MSEPLGHVVLRAVAGHFRNHPESWTTGAGTIYQRMEDDPEYQCKPGDDGCIYTLIVYCGKRYGGKVAVDQAVRVLCEHHGIKVEPGAIFAFNDSQCGTVERAIEFVEGPMTGNKLVMTSTPLPEATSMSRLRIAAVLAVLFVLSLFGQYPSA